MTFTQPVEILDLCIFSERNKKCKIPLNTRSNTCTRLLKFNESPKLRLSEKDDVDANAWTCFHTTFPSSRVLCQRLWPQRVWIWTRCRGAALHSIETAVFRLYARQTHVALESWVRNGPVVHKITSIQFHEYLSVKSRGLTYM